MNMTITRKAALAILIGGSLTFGIVPASADEGKPRYVSGAGSDSGDCENRFRPCRTLTYAIGKAGKGDSVLVAEGRYTVGSARDLADLLTVQGRLSAGFSSYSGYSEQNARASTTLIGVPPELRERYEQVGFTVIVDTKSLVEAVPDEEERRQMSALAVEVQASQQSHASAPCVAGASSGFPCQSVSLLAHLSLQDMEPLSSSGNDVWGFVDLNTGREYVLMGLRNGVAVIDVTDPAAPAQVGAVRGTSTTWRDIKVLQRYDGAARRWRAYAYATADNVVDYMMVLDLSDLPNGVEQVAYSSDFRSAHNVYLVGADYTYGLSNGGNEPLLGIAGGGTSGGNFRLYSLAQPRSPSLLFVSNRGYAHDLASATLTDVRKDSQCVNAQGAPACELLADFNENTVDLWDITLPSAPARLASYAYSNASYVHSGWFTEGAQHLVVQDELDEINVGLNTTVRVLGLGILSNPSQIGAWIGPSRAIDHNGFAKGNRYYLSNYSQGLTVLDITNPAAPQRVGYFDTMRTSNDTAFIGAWGAYPFLASGTVAVSDMNSGLYLLANETLNAAQGSFAIATPAVAGAEGQSVDIVVSRLGGSADAVSVELAVLSATADAADATLAVQSLAWASGETQDKTVTVDLVADGLSEELEFLLVRLQSPQQGATIAYPDTARVHIYDAGSPTRLRLLDSSMTVDEAHGQAFVVATRHGSAAGEVRVRARTLPGASYGGFSPVDTELVWSDGDVDAKTVAVGLDPAALGSGESASFELELYSPTGATLEDASGGNAATLLARVTVRDNSPPPPDPTPSGGGGGGGGGGGAFDWLSLIALLLLVGCRARFDRAREDRSA